MNKRFSLLGRVSVAFFLLSSVFVSMVPPVAPGAKQRGNITSFIRSLQSAPVYSLTCKKSAAGNGHIKVRYMGGDCSYDPPFSIGARIVSYNGFHAAGSPGSYVLLRRRFSFKLRGPPAQA